MRPRPGTAVADPTDGSGRPPQRPPVGTSSAWPSASGPTGPWAEEHAARPRRRVRVALTMVFLLIPAAFLRNTVAGLQLSGWAWLLVLLTVAPLVLTQPLHPRSVRSILPYLLFLLYASATLAWAPSLGKGVATLIQLLVPALTFLLAWRVPHSVELRGRWRPVCWLGLGIAAVLTAVAVSQGGVGKPAGAVLSTRSMSIALTVLFVVATIDARSWRYTVLVWVGAMTVSLAVGSRLASAVLVMLLLISPSLRLRWQGRLALTVTSLLFVVMLSGTEAFQQRFFFERGASLVDVLRFSDTVNTAGRRELWPNLIRRCSEAPLTGLGIAASYEVTEELTGGTLEHPHNEYLRTYCDEGWIGSILFWGFFLLAAGRSWRGVFTGPDPPLHGAAGLLVVTLLVFSFTDNPSVYTVHFMAPMAVILGLSERALGRRPSLRPEVNPGAAGRTRS
jgi:O-antigen ligase